MAAADAVDPLVGPHRAPAVALAPHLHRAAATAAHVAGRPQQSPAATVLDVEVGRGTDPQVGAEQAGCLGAGAGVVRGGGQGWNEQGQGDGKRGDGKADSHPAQTIPGVAMVACP